MRFLGINSVLLLLVATLVSCAEDRLTPMRSTDLLMVKVHRINTVDATFRISFETRQRYGCKAELAYSLTRGKDGIIQIQVHGIANTGPKCELEPIPEGVELVSLDNRTNFTLEIAFRRRTDRYTLLRNGADSWTLTKILDQGLSYAEVSPTLF